MSDIRTFNYHASDAELDDLRQRLNSSRWAEPETPDDWSQGVPLAYLRELCGYWADGYDWRRCETALNQYPQFVTKIDGLDIQFMHIRSPHEDALPLVMTHGWPGSVLEFMKVVGPLSDPTAHGGSASDAFHIVCPTLPGFGYSGKPTAPGWNIERIGRAWGELMARLGYSSYVAQGGDWGSLVTLAMGVSETEHCAMLHSNMPVLSLSEEILANPDATERKYLARSQNYWDVECGYSKEQSTRPQTVGYGLVDSPIAQAAWVVEKFWSWSDCNGHPENIFSRDELLDNIMLYWLPAAGASSARIYWESFASLLQPQPQIHIPVAVSIYPLELFPASRRWCEERFTKLVHYNELDRGGHFAAFEQPELFINELRTSFAHVCT